MASSYLYCLLAFSICNTSWSQSVTVLPPMLFESDLSEGWNAGDDVLLVVLLMLEGTKWVF